MNFISFDIECCDGYHICEFGYVIFDKNFQIIEKNVLLINPKKKFKFSKKRSYKPINFYYTIEEYNQSPVFKKYYNLITTLLTTNYVIGFSTKCDIFYLNIACKRYGQSIINFNYFDLQKAFSYYLGSKQLISLKKIANHLEIIHSLYFHKSDDDAHLTMLCLKKMYENIELELKSFFELFSKAVKNIV